MQMSSIVPFKIIYLLLSDLSQSRCYIHLRWSCFWFVSWHRCDSANFVNGSQEIFAMFMAISLECSESSLYFCLTLKTFIVQFLHIVENTYRNLLFDTREILQNGGYRKNISCLKWNTFEFAFILVCSLHCTMAQAMKLMKLRFAKSAQK